MMMWNTTNRHRHSLVAVAVAAAAFGWLASQVATVRERRQLQLAALRDPLTGLLNRAGWDRYAARVVAAAHRGGRPAAVAVFDVDWLKRLNDTCGHSAGDAALRALASRLAAAIATPGLVARIGGDEFAAILVGPLRASARWLPDIVDDLHRQLNRPGSSPHELTVSVGVAALTSEDSVESALARADRRMYRSKHTHVDNSIDSETTRADPFLGLPSHQRDGPAHRTSSDGAQQAFHDTKTSSDRW